MARRSHSLLILAVTTVLLAFLFTGSQAWSTVLVVIVTLLALILVAGGSAQLLPAVLEVVLRELRRVMRP
jgi:hypothetical protein